MSTSNKLQSPPIYWKCADKTIYQEPAEVCEITFPYVDDNRPYVAIQIYHLSIKALLDSGSNYTLISTNIFAKFGKVKLNRPLKDIQLRSACGSQLKVLGQAQLPFKFNNHVRLIYALVVENLCIDCICGMDFWRKFNIAPTMLKKDAGSVRGMFAVTDNRSSDGKVDSILSAEQANEIDKIKKQFLAASEKNLTLTNQASHRIVLKEEWKDKPPVRQFPYVMSPKTQALVAEELKRLLDLGILERSNSEWSLNCVPVVKPNKVRLCLDARKINERTVRDAYPLPHPGRILGQLPKAQFLSTIDLSEAFLQIPLEKESRKFTAFSVQGKGLFQYTRMPFGLINSPATLARLMDQVLGHGELEPYVFVYLDDIVVVTESFEHHVQLLAEIARRLRLANLSINIAKSRFGVPEISFLGYLLGVDGLRANPDKIKPIVEYERPTTVTKLRRFIGMVNYYRRFIADFSGVTAALTDLLQTNQKVIQWNEAAEKAFCQIKEKLITSPILGSPDFNHEFIIQTDASDVAVAAVLSQRQPDGEKVISYYSHKLTTPQRNYHAAEKEALAALMAIEAFRGYIEGYHFTLVTDSSALTHILSTKWKVGSRCSRWALNLQQFNMTVIHRKGKDNIVPDALSRSIATVIQNDPTSWYFSLKQKVIDKPDKFVDFRIENGVLQKFVTAHDDEHDCRFDWKIIPTPESIDAILKSCHDNCFHPGFEKTLQRIKQRYYWPKMSSQVRRYVQQCGTCKEVKGASIPVNPEMGKQRLASQPWQIISADYVGPLPRSRRGNQYLLVVADFFSKWVLLQPVKSIKSSNLCAILKEQWFSKNSVPEIIITDNASCFTSKEFKHLLDQYKIVHWLNSRYHSQANPVERVNRTINAAIRTYVKEDQRSWDTRTAEMEMILNTSVHSSTGYTPYFVTHGHELSEFGTDHQLVRHQEPLNEAEKVERRKAQFSRIYDVVQRNLTKSHEASRHRYNLRHRHFAKPFHPGQLVYRRNMRQSNAGERYNAKYGPQYLPCFVGRKIGTSSYELVSSDGKGLGIWPAAHLKPG